MNFDEEAQNETNTEEQIKDTFDDIKVENLRFIEEDPEEIAIENFPKTKLEKTSSSLRTQNESFFLKLKTKKKDDNNIKDAKNESKLHEKNANRNFRDFYLRFKNWTSRKGLIPILRSTLSILIYSALIWPEASSDFFGFGGALGSLSVILFDSTLTRGAAIQSSFIFAFCLGIGSGISAFAYWTSLKVGNSFAILHLFFWSYVLPFARAKLSIRWTVPLMLTHLTFISTLLLAIRPDHSFDYIFKTFFGVFCGSAISLVVTLTVFPKSAAFVLKKEMEFTCKTSLELLRLSVDAFLQRASKQDINELALLEKNTKKHVASLTLKLEEFKWEWTRSKYPPEEVEKMVTIMRGWVVQMRSMCSCCCIQKKLLKKDNNIKKVILSLAPVLSQISTADSNVLREISKEFETRGWKDFLMRKETEKKMIRLEELEGCLSKLLAENDRIIKGIFHQNTENPLQNWDDIFLIYFFVFNFVEFSIELKKLASFLNQKRLEKPTTQIWAPAYWKSLFHSEKKEEIPIDKRGIQENESEHRIRFAIHRQIIRFFGDTSSHYAIKVALAILIASMWQFIPETTGWYQSWRGEWAPITITVVFGPSALGGNMVDSALRMIGTAVGAVWAIISWLAFPRNGGGLFFMLLLISIPGFYTKMNNPYPKIGSVTLITYTIIIFNLYFERNNPAFFSVYELAYKRTVMTAMGVIIIVCLDRILWPQLARVEMRNQISSLLALSSSIYGKTLTLLLANKADPTLLKEIRKEQTLASLKLVKAETLLRYSKIEPRLLGPLPVKHYKSIIEDTSLLLDRTVSLRTAVSKGFSEEIRQRLILPLQEYRKEMVSHCLMLFWVASSSLKWKKKLPQYLPDARKSRQKILVAIQKSPFFRDGSAIQNSSELLQYYAWLMATKEIAILLHGVLNTLKELFGEEANIPNFDWNMNNMADQNL